MTMMSVLVIEARCVRVEQEHEEGELSLRDQRTVSRDHAI